MRLRLGRMTRRSLPEACGPEAVERQRLAGRVERADEGDGLAGGVGPFEPIASGGGVEGELALLEDLAPLGRHGHRHRVPAGELPGPLVRLGPALEAVGRRDAHPLPAADHVLERGERGGDLGTCRLLRGRGGPPSMAPTTTAAITPRIIGTSRLRREGPARPAPPAPTSVTARWVRRQKRGGVRVSADSPEGGPTSPRRRSNRERRPGGGVLDADGSRFRGGGLGADRGVLDVVDVADHHLFERLLAPDHPLGGVGVGRVLRRVVEVGQAVDPGPARHRLGLGQGVVALPAEVVGRDRQEDLARPSG